MGRDAATLMARGLKSLKGAKARDPLHFRNNMAHAESEQLPFTELAIPNPIELPHRKRIYCNRDLRFDLIDAIGFDMDYTLAVYKQEAIDRVSIESTVEKLIERGYPEALRSMPVHLRFPIRGLLVDRKLGNIIKTDRYRYPKKAFHGTRLLTSEERRRIYANNRIRPGTARYHSIDTLYALSEATLYAAAIDVLDHELANINYGSLFDDIRACIDEAHRDGSIKDRIRGDLGAYLERDPDLGLVLHKLRSAGKKLFLLTNSEPDYTDAVMGHLLGGNSEYAHWARYFDVVVADAKKPLFFTGDESFYEVGKVDQPADALERGRVYQGGSLAEFERLLEVTGDRILYVGDHIFGDVLRAKKVSAWRTLMIIQELRDELKAVQLLEDEIERMHRLEQRRYQLIDQLRERQAEFKAIARKLEQLVAGGETLELEAERTRLKRAVDRLRMQLKSVELEHAELERQIDEAHHPFWGSVFKAESELSSFGEQVERYACVYTDRVTNLLHYGLNHFFRGPRHRMAHELL